MAGALPRALAIVVGGLVFSGTLASRAQVLATQDLYLHISIGRWILANGRVPDHDVFSATMLGAPWVAHEWLASVCWAFLYEHFGWGGVLVLTALSLAVAIAVLVQDVSRSLGPLGAVVVAVLAWGLAINHLVARPHVLVLPLMVIWMVAHVRARQGDRIPPYFLVALMTLWANLHGSFMFGLAFSVLFALEAVLASETKPQARASALRWGGFIGAAVLSALVTPHGMNGLLFPFQMTNMPVVLSSITEWEASSLTNNAPLILWCLLLAFTSLWLGAHLSVSRLAMLLLLVYLAFAHRRHTELLGFAAPLLVQHEIAAQFPSAAGYFSAWGPLARPAARVSLVAAAFFVAGIATFVFGRDFVRVDRFTPAAALAQVEKREIRGPVLNAYNFGGYLIFRGYAPFVDGRADMYGDKFMAEYTALDQLAVLLERYRISWTILGPTNPRIAVMDALPGWSRVYADSVAVIHVRRSGAAR